MLKVKARVYLHEYITADDVLTWLAQFDPRVHVGTNVAGEVYVVVEDVIESEDELREMYQGDKVEIIERLPADALTSLVSNPTLDNVLDAPWATSKDMPMLRPLMELATSVRVNGVSTTWYALREALGHEDTKGIFGLFEDILWYYHVGRVPPKDQLARYVAWLRQ